jgi:hypothetical protein
MLAEPPLPELYSEAVENFSRPLAGCTDDREAKITLGSASFVDRIKGPDRERRAAARAETAEGKTAGTETSRSRGSVTENC